MAFDLPPHRTDLPCFDRHRNQISPARHRNATLFPTRFLVGVHSLRRRRRFLRLLDERCGGSTDEDAAAEERDLDREAKEEGGTGRARGTTGCGRAGGEAWYLHCDKLRLGQGRGGRGEQMGWQACSSSSEVIKSFEVDPCSQACTNITREWNERCMETSISTLDPKRLVLRGQSIF